MITHIKDFAPRHIACYVNKKYLKEGYPDVWTVVFTKANCWQIPKDAPEWLKAGYRGKVRYIGMTQSGACYHDTAERGRFCPGTRIAFRDLTEGQRRTVIEEYEACWQIKMKLSDGNFPAGWEAAWE